MAQAAPAGWLIILAVLLVAVAGAFASMETAMVRVSRQEASRLAAERRRGAADLVIVLDEGPRAVNAAIFLRVACEMAAAVCVTLAVGSWLPRWWSALLIAAALTSIASFVLAGVSPRTVARQHPMGVALALAPLLRALTVLLGPVAGLLVLLGNAVTPGRGFRNGPFTSEDELRELVDIASETDVIEADERRMIQSVFEIGETRVREVMVPRTDMVTLPAGTSLETSMGVFLRSGFSRIPVIGDEGIDEPLGVLYLKDVARRLHSGHLGNESMPVERAMRPPFFVPESQRVDSLLRVMQGHLRLGEEAEEARQGQPTTGQLAQVQGRSGHVALVVDEYGGTAGMVTIEDLVEEVIGEISDEYDREAPAVESLGPDAYRVTARLPIDDLADLFDLEIEEDEVDSVAGLLGKELGTVPIPGATATCHGLVLTAEGLVGRRNKVASVLVHRARQDAIATGEGHNGRRHHD